MNSELLNLIHDDIREVKDDVKSIYKILNGNGHEGLTHKVSRNSEFRKKVENREMRLWGALASLGIGIAVVLFKVFIL